jgi:hypothetical protein
MQTSHAAPDTLSLTTLSDISSSHAVMDPMTQANNINTLRNIANNPNTPARTLDKILVRNISALHANIAKHPNASPVALFVIASKSQDVSVLCDIAKHANIDERAVKTLLKKQHDLLNKWVMSCAPLNEQQFVTLWAKNGVHRQSLLTNQHLSTTTLTQLVSVTDEKEQALIAQHPHADVTLLATLSKSSSMLVKQAVATNPNTPEIALARLARETRANVYFYVTKNPCTPASVLASMRGADSSSVREGVAGHVNTDTATLILLSKDKEAMVRRAVITNPNTPLPTLKQLASDRSPTVSQWLFKNPNMGVISELERFELILINSGYGAFDFYNIRSPKKVTQLLINSKHPNEVEFLFGSKHADALDALSALQSAFTNRKGKLNRADYLTFLADVNDNVTPEQRRGLAVDNISLIAAFTHFNTQLVIDILHQYQPDEAKDTVRMLSSLVRFADPAVNKKNVDTINKWLEKPTHKVGALHDYLTKLNAVLLESDALPFWQNCFIEQLPEAKKLLDIGMVLNFPTNSSQLLAIGSAQRHCVGTKFYAERCIDGSNIIFQIAPKDNMKQGYTFQFNRAGRLIQAKGFANSRVPEHATRLAKAILTTLKKSA